MKRYCQCSDCLKYQLVSQILEYLGLMMPPHSVINKDDKTALRFMAFLSKNIPVTCPSTGLSNGGITFTRDPVNGRYLVGTYCFYSCNYGYHLSGDTRTSCTFVGRWNGQDGTCKRRNNTHLTLA